MSRVAGSEGGLERAVGVAVQRALGLLLLAVAATALLAPRNSWFVFRPGVVGVVAVLTVFGLIGVAAVERRGVAQGISSRRSASTSARPSNWCPPVS